MKRVGAREAKNRFGQLIDDAQRGPVTIEKNGRPFAVGQSFADFEARVAEFTRCLKRGGLLFLHTCNFRFSDTTSASQFEPILWAEPKDMAKDRHYDRQNRLIEGPACRAVGFRKRQ